MLTTQSGFIQAKQKNFAIINTCNYQRSPGFVLKCQVKV